jgi:hypothetical protein
MPPRCAGSCSVEPVAQLRVIDSTLQLNQPYREFTRRAMAAGVQGYIAFLRGKRVTYWAALATSTRNGSPGPCRTGHHWPRPIESYCAAVCDFGMK